MRKKNILKLLFTVVMLMGISIAWAADTYDEDYKYTSSKCKAVDDYIKAKKAKWSDGQKKIAAIGAKTDDQIAVFDALSKKYSEYTNLMQNVINEVGVEIQEIDAEYKASGRKSAKDLSDAKKTELINKLDSEIDPIQAKVDVEITANAQPLYEAYVDLELALQAEKKEKAVAVYNIVKSQNWVVTPSMSSKNGAYNSWTTSVATALADLDTNKLIALKSTTTDYTNALQALSDMAQQKLQDEVKKAQENYESAYFYFTKKYEGTDELRTYQKEILPYQEEITEIEEYVNKTYTIEWDYEEWDNTDLIDNYNEKYKALEANIKAVEKIMNDNKETYEKYVVEKNATLVNDWINGTLTGTYYDSETGAANKTYSADEQKGSYKNMNDTYEEAARDMDDFKALANEAKTDAEKEAALATIAEAEKELYTYYPKIEQVKKDVETAQSNADTNPVDATTSYLEIDTYIDQSLEIIANIEKTIEAASNAVKAIAQEKVSDVLKDLGMRAWDANDMYNDKQNWMVDRELDGEKYYTNDIKSGAQNAWASFNITSGIKVSNKTVKVTTDAYTVANVSLNSGAEKGSQNVEDFTYTFSMDADGVTARNYEAVITALENQFEDRYESIHDTWYERQKTVNAEEDADEAISTLNDKVQAYWTQALGKMSRSEYKELATEFATVKESIRKKIDNADSLYNKAVANDATKIKVGNVTRDRYSWEKTYIQQAEESLIASLTEVYNTLYKYAEPEAAEATATKQTAADDAITALNTEIKNAQTTLKTLKSDESKAAASEAIAAAQAALTEANAANTAAATNLGSAQDDALDAVASDATAAQQTLAAAIAAAVESDKMVGDFDGDGKITMNDVIKAYNDGELEDILDAVSAYKAK